MRLYPECEKCAHRESDINGACGICTQTAPSQFVKREAEPDRAPCGQILPGCDKMTYVGMTGGGHYEVRKRGDPAGDCNQVIEHGNCPEGFKPEEIFPEECTREPCPECGNRVVFRNVYRQWKCISCGIDRHAPDQGYEIHIKECPLADILDDDNILCTGTDQKPGNYNCPDLVIRGKCPNGYHRVDYTPYCDRCGILMKLKPVEIMEYYCPDCEKQ